MSVARSLRWRLTLAFIAVATVAVTGATGAMAVILQHAVWRPIDAMLREECESLVAIHELGRLEDLPRAAEKIRAEKDIGHHKFLRITDSSGRILGEAGVAPSSAAQLAPPTERHVGYTSFRSQDKPYRIVWCPVAGGGWSQEGVQVMAQVRSLRRAYSAIALAAVVLLALLAFLAWTISTRATADLGRLAAELETIEAGSLDRRMVARTTSEVDRLATVVNRLLARLETGVGHLRRFTADAAHELRTPLAALRAHLEVAIARPASVDVYREGLLDALEQTERLGRLAEDLLTLSAVEAGVGSADGVGDLVRLDAVAREVAEFLEPVAQEQGRSFACQAAEPVAVRGATGLLKRLVLNLVDNAFRHTPTTAEVRLVVRSANGTATVEVSDGGPGIPADEMELVFQRFHRGRGGSGTGLGLALCREIAARHRGEIAIRSAPGTGTTVVVTLPVA
jgi:signal transduction histidine kinase